MKRRGQNETGSDRLSKYIPNVQLWQDVKNIKLWNILQDNGFADNQYYGQLAWSDCGTCDRKAPGLPFNEQPYQADTSLRITMRDLPELGPERA